MKESKSPARKRREAVAREFPSGRIADILIEQVAALAPLAKRTLAFEALLAARDQALSAHPKTEREKRRDGEVI